MPRTRRTPEQITNEIIDKGADLLTEIVNIEKNRTDLYRDLAQTVVQLRLRFKDKGGRPDVAGRSQAYRNAAARMFELAGVPADSESSIQSAIRYHVGNALREQMPADALREAGLQIRRHVRPRQTAAEAHRAGNGHGPEPVPEEGDAWAAVAAMADEDHVVVDLTESEPDVALLTDRALAMLKKAREAGLSDPREADKVLGILDDLNVEAALFRAEVVSHSSVAAGIAAR